MPSPWRSLCSVKYWVHIPHSTIQFLFQPSFCKHSEGHFQLGSHLGSRHVPGQAHGVERQLTRVKRSSQTITMNNVITLTNWCQFCYWSKILNFVIDNIFEADYMYFDNVMTKFIVNKRTDTRKTDINLVFTITNWQIVWAHLLHQWTSHYKIIINSSVCHCPPIDKEN